MLNKVNKIKYSIYAFAIYLYRIKVQISERNNFPASTNIKIINIKII